MYSDNVYNIGRIFILHQFAKDLCLYHDTSIFMDELIRMNRFAIRNNSTLIKHASLNNKRIVNKNVISFTT